MDQPAPLTAPYFDFDFLRQEAKDLLARIVQTIDALKSHLT